MNHVRETGIDLLKVILMYMVVVLHVLGQGGVLENSKVFSMSHAMVWFMEILAMCAVNAFAMASGYIMIEREFKYYRIIVLWLQVAFYTVGISALLYTCLPYTVETKDIVKAVFPVATGQYWYFTAYFGVFFFMPFINKLVNSLDKRENMILVITIMVLLSVVSLYGDVFYTKKGYSFVWLMAMYIIGASMKKSDIKSKFSRKKAMILYFGIACILLLVKQVMENMDKNVRGEDTNLIQYTSPFVVLMAVALLIGFLHIKLSGKIEKLVCFLSKISFSVYLIHTNPFVFRYILKDAFAGMVNPNPFLQAVAVLVTAFIIYIGCLGIDILRYELFKIVDVNRCVECAAQKIENTKVLQKLKR